MAGERSLREFVAVRPTHFVLGSMEVRITYTPTAHTTLLRSEQKIPKRHKKFQENNLYYLFRFRDSDQNVR